jgi:hypothetical protein
VIDAVFSENQVSGVSPASAYAKASADKSARVSAATISRL